MPTEQPRLSDQFKNEVESPHHLNHVIPEIKNPLPDQQNIEQEKEHIQFKESIEDFEKKKLQHVKPEEKIVLPTKQDIDIEKLPKLAADFNKSNLHHVEPVVKHDVEVIEQ